MHLLKNEILTLKAKMNQTVLRQELEIRANTSGHIAATTAESESGAGEEVVTTQLPPGIEFAVGGSENDRDYSMVDERKLNLTEEDLMHLDILKKQYEDDEITQKGLNIKRAKILRPYVRRFLAEDNERRISELYHANHTTTPENGADKLEFQPVNRQLLWSQSEESSSSDQKPKSMIDSYGESLLHVNRLFSKNFGHSRREVPSHIPHFVDKSVLEALHDSFPNEFEATSANAFRSGNDMQFSFAYFHFLMGQRRNESAGEIFDEFDTDGSGTWSDREIRTLLARMHSLPLYLDTVRRFEEKIINCSKVAACILT